jgi:hypothetical protein
MKKKSIIEKKEQTAGDYLVGWNKLILFGGTFRGNGVGGVCVCV